MKKIIALVIVLTAFMSCKSKQALIAEQSAEEARSVKEIADGHYATTRNFNTLFISAKARYEDRKQTQNVSAEVRIKKDEIITVSIRVLGITLAKALITPEKVSYYEKINGTYFEGDYALLSRWLGTPLDYSKVQNILLGEAMDNLYEGSYTANIEDGLYKLQTKTPKNGISKNFLFEAAGFLLKKQLVTQNGSENRSLDIQYPAHVKYPKAVVPSRIEIRAQQKENVSIDIDYNTVTFDENLTFPYSVPSGAKRIYIE